MPLNANEMKSTLLEMDLKRSNFPHPEDLADLLRSGERISDAVGEHVAKFVLGEIKRPIGRRPLKRDQRLKRQRLAAEVELRTALNKEDGISNAREKAIRDTAAANNLSEGTVDKQVYRRNRR